MNVHDIVCTTPHHTRFVLWLTTATLTRPVLIVPELKPHGFQPNRKATDAADRFTKTSLVHRPRALPMSSNSF
jgi:hypothetical protein